MRAHQIMTKHVITVAITLFIISMSTLMFFVGTDNEFQKSDYKTDVVESIKTKSYEEQEKTYRELLHNEKDPFAVVDNEGKIEFTSENFGTTLGFTRDEVIHRLFQVLLDKEDLSIFLSAFSKVNRSHEPLMMIGPYHIHDKNNESHVHMGSIVPLLEKGKVINIGVITKDIGKAIHPENTSEPKKNGPLYPHGKKILNEDDKGERWMAKIVDFPIPNEKEGILK